MKLLPALLVAACALLPQAFIPVLAAATTDGAPRCLYVEIASMPIRYVGLGLAPAVDGSIDGTPATMLVDTGAFATQLTMNGANKRDMGLQMTGRMAEGVGGWSRLYQARVREIVLGPTKSRRSGFLPVIGEADITPAFDAIVGAPFLLQADLEMDLRAKRMRFLRGRDCDKTDLVIWKEDTIAVPFERNPDASPNPHFTVTVDGRKLDAIIDTGAHHTLILADAAKRLGIDLADPRVKRVGEATGIGSERAPEWSATFDSVDIGGEIIHNAELGILEARGDLRVDMLIGQDFLRAHRVLFAMSQKKLYIAYLGGTPFSRSAGLEPWMREEAESGNPDAQFTLAHLYGSGRGVARDPARSRAWMEKAAAGGEPHARLLTGRQALLSSHADQAIPHLRAGLDQLPADRYGPLWLYLARVRNGEADLGKRELQASLRKQEQDDWPRPIADFYVGKLDEAGLLGAAAGDPKLARRRSCQANTYMAEWHAAHGDRARSDSMMASVRAHCGAPQAGNAGPSGAPSPASPST